MDHQEVILKHIEILSQLKEAEIENENGGANSRGGGGETTRTR